MKNTENNAPLIKRKDGSIRLTYSTKTDIEYVSFQDRQYLQPVPTDPDMFGLTKSQWTKLLCEGQAWDPQGHGVRLSGVACLAGA